MILRDLALKMQVAGRTMSRSSTHDTNGERSLVSICLSERKSLQDLDRREEGRSLQAVAYALLNPSYSIQMPFQICCHRWPHMQPCLRYLPSPRLPSDNRGQPPGWLRYLASSRSLQPLLPSPYGCRLARTGGAAKPHVVGKLSQACLQPKKEVSESVVSLSYFGKIFYIVVKRHGFSDFPGFGNCAAFGFAS